MRLATGGGGLISLAASKPDEHYELGCLTCGRD